VAVAAGGDELLGDQLVLGIVHVLGAQRDLVDLLPSPAGQLPT